MYWKATTVKVGSLCVFLCVRVTRGFGLARVQARLIVVMIISTGLWGLVFISLLFFTILYVHHTHRHFLN